MVGFAWNALREAVFGLQADRLPLVRYVSLTANPLRLLAAIYETIGEKPFTHDLEHIEPCHDMVECDARLGTPELHDVGTAVRARPRARSCRCSGVMGATRSGMTRRCCRPRCAWSNRAGSAMYNRTPGLPPGP